MAVSLGIVISDSQWNLGRSCIPHSARAQAQASNSSPLPQTNPPSSPTKRRISLSTIRQSVSPLKRSGTIVEITPSDTGLGTHVIWKRNQVEVVEEMEAEEDSGGSEAEVEADVRMDEDETDTEIVETPVNTIPPTTGGLGRYTTPANQFFLQQIPGAPYKPRRVSNKLPRTALPPKWNLGKNGTVLQSHFERADEDMESVDEIMDGLRESPTFVLANVGAPVALGGARRSMAPAQPTDLRSPIDLNAPSQRTEFKKALGPCGTELLDDDGRQLWVFEHAERQRRVDTVLL